MNGVPKTYGEYAILGVLGQGGMGVVYDAEHVSLRRRVALKVLAEHAIEDPIALARLRREALAMGALQHPHIVQVSDFSEGPPPYLVMERLTGQSLRERLVQRGPMPAADACLVAVQLLAALAAAHRAGIVHRDVKPANIFIVDTPLTEVYVKLLDFGVAKDLTPRAGPSLTATDSIIGSAPYMAPEQIRGEPIDARTDIFAVGVTLYEMLAGRRPFVAAGNQSVVYTILRGGPIAPLTPSVNVPRDLETIVMRALRGERESRYATAEEMSAALQPFVVHSSLGAVATSAMTIRTTGTGASTVAAPHALRTSESMTVGTSATSISSTLRQTAPPVHTASLVPHSAAMMHAPRPSHTAPRQAAGSSRGRALVIAGGAATLLVLGVVAAAIALQLVPLGRRGVSLSPGIPAPGAPFGESARLDGSCTLLAGDGAPLVCLEYYLPAKLDSAKCREDHGTPTPGTCNPKGAVGACRYPTLAMYYYPAGPKPDDCSDGRKIIP